MARQQPEQQAPPVQRLRVHYAKRGRLRFTSHRDFARAFERALVRFAHAYADQNEQDHRTLVEAIADGRVVAEAGV